MASTREMRLRIRSVKNLAQVTRALETVSASKVRKAIQANDRTRPYAERAWRILTDLASQPGHQTMHPLLAERDEVKNVLVILISSDRGLAGAYNVNVVREALAHFVESTVPISYLTVGKRGREMLLRRHRNVVGEFSGLSANPTFLESAAIGQLAVDEFLRRRADQVYVVYTDYRNMLVQIPVVRKILPFSVSQYDEPGSSREPAAKAKFVFTYEPSQEEILHDLIPDFTALQIYQAILSALASEHAARMVAMRNATNSAKDLVTLLQLEYNQVRQAGITNDMLDISGGAEALAQTTA
ncbi:MAG TPA: ATP synthase F1 subunit gamma [Bellilinea sp.]|nr:ATP synthase F1 subunit gamma [Bellilinea sp.]